MSLERAALILFKKQAELELKNLPQAQLAGPFSQSLIGANWRGNMPDVNQYVFSYKELLEMMVKKAGLHEGKWSMLVNLGFAAINGGPSPDQIVPTGLVAIQAIGIQKSAPDAIPALTIDAAEVNPGPAKGSNKRKSA